MEKSVSEKVVRVHPLAIASICDHYTRVAMGGSIFKKNDPVVGLLFGTQEGLTVDIIDATDAIYNVDAQGEVILDMGANFPNPLDPEDKNNKMDLVIAPFIEMQYELLGWYTLGASNEPEPWCMGLHQKIKTVNEAPLFVLMDHSPAPDAKQLPMTVFEAETHTNVEKESVESFVTLPFNLETSQTERIAVNQVTKQGPSDGGSSLELQNVTLATSLGILEKKIGIIVAALEHMQQTGQIDQALLRKANCICQQLPAVDNATFHGTFQRDLADTVMTSYLSAATKTSSALAEVSELYSAVFNEKAKGFKDVTDHLDSA
jgi:hypothetical protein